MRTGTIGPDEAELSSVCDLVDMKEDLGQNPVLTLLVKRSAGTHDINLLYIMQSQYHCLVVCWYSLRRLTTIG